MVLRRTLPKPALVVPDAETCLAFGGAADDWVPTEEPGRARLLLLPERVPEPLVAAVLSAWSLMPADRIARSYALSLPGAPADELLHRGEDPGDAAHRGEQEGHDEHEGDGDADHGDDHGDMMAITGEPSADGLVMETMDVQAGPLGVALPGGLLIQARLDGDVVAACQVRATLTVEAPEPPDPWSAVAWTAAGLAASERVAGVAPQAARWFRLAAVEVERAVGLLAWLHGFCRLLAWRQMTEQVRVVLAAAVSARGSLPVALTTPDVPDMSTDGIRSALSRAGEAATALGGALSASPSFGRRTSGLGRLSAEEAATRGLAGPVARASGVAADARADDPGYAALGFEPLVRQEGDARARALLRAAEVAQSLHLAEAAVERAGGRGGGDVTPRFGRPPGGLVESARGPVRVLVGADEKPQRTAPGARIARQAAGELAVGREWAAALVTVASFDLSPWRVGP